MIETLFAAAITLSGYGSWCNANPTECVAPQVESRSPDWLMRHCQSTGGCYMRTNVVFINDKIPVESLNWEALVVHEMTHYLQRKSGKWGGYRNNPCHRYRSEIEAYAAQRAYAKKKGAIMVIDVPNELRVTCEAALAHGLVKDTDK